MSDTYVMSSTTYDERIRMLTVLKRTVCKDGYVDVKLSDGRWIREHRWVMEKHLGRRLWTSEVVHHINGNKSDNRIDNLEVLTYAAHRSRHADDVSAGMRRWVAEHHAAIDAFNARRSS